MGDPHKLPWKFEWDTWCLGGYSGWDNFGGLTGPPPVELFILKHSFVPLLAERFFMISWWLSEKRLYINSKPSCIHSIHSIQYMSMELSILRHSFMPSLAERIFMISWWLREKRLSLQGWPSVQRLPWKFFSCLHLVYICDQVTAHLRYMRNSIQRNKQNRGTDLTETRRRAEIPKERGTSYSMLINEWQSTTVIYVEVTCTAIT